MLATWMRINEFSARGHGIAGIERQVEEDLFDHGAIAVNERDLGGGLNSNLTFVPRTRLSDLARLATTSRRSRRRVCRPVRPAEQEQLLRQAGRALGGGNDRLHGFLQFRWQGGPGHQHAGVSWMTVSMLLKS